MQLIEKLTILSDAAKYDASCASGGSKREGNQTGLGSTTGMGICHSYTPDGRCVSLLKILLTNYCIYECQYCINRNSSNVQRARFRPEEVVQLTIDFYKRNYIEGLFLSSGIIVNSDYTMEQLIRVARSLREDHQFRGYIHLKTIPGAADELITEAGLWADRLSINIELPTENDLQQLAPEKHKPEIEAAMATVQDKSLEIAHDRKHGMKPPSFAPAGQSTQMIVGATPTPDRDILTTASSLYKTHHLRRVYYSGYSPIPDHDDRLPGFSPPLLREHRLYQADWLFRFYGFDVAELTTSSEPDLDLEVDPKTTWALRNLHRFPIDVNQADRAMLLRIPGIGTRNVDRMIAIRRHHTLRLADMMKLRIVWKRAKWFVTVADYHPKPTWYAWDGFIAKNCRPSLQPTLF